MIIYNRIGWWMLAAGFGLGYVITWLLGVGDHSGPKESMIAMPFAIAFDTLYRKSAHGHWFHPDNGGHFFLLPVWL